MLQAYAFCAEYHGLDINASWLWIEYTTFKRDYKNENP